MKEKLASILYFFVTINILLIISVFSMPINNVFATNDTEYEENEATSQNAIDEKTESHIVEIKKKETKSLDDYKEKYGSDAYGLVAYILNLVRIYSIPFCFLGIAIGAIYQYIIGIRKLDTQEKGMGLIVSFVTIFIICQVLPLIFVMVVKLSNV